MNKGVHDVIRPQWIFDSIANGELVPMSKKYFFHATAERMVSEEYNNSDDDLEPRSPGEDVAAEMTGSPGVVDSKPKEDNSEMQDWLQIKPEVDASDNDRDDADSATDPDSDNEDNWFNVGPPQSESGEASGMEVIFCVSFKVVAFIFIPSFPGRC